MTLCLAIFLSSCAATPVLTDKGDMSREIRQKAPVVSSVDISPDGRYVLSGSLDSFILWDIRRGEKVQTFTHESFLDNAIKVAFSPDGKHFASGGKGTKLWDFATKKELRTFDDLVALSITFSPDGREFIYGGRGKDSIKIFDTATGRTIKDFKLQPDAVYSIAHSPDGRYVISGCGDSGLTLWNHSSGTSIKQVVVGSGSTGRIVRTVAFSPDGKYALSGGGNNSVILWNAKDLTRVKEFSGHTGVSGILWCCKPLMPGARLTAGRSIS